MIVPSTINNIITVFSELMMRIGFQSFTEAGCIMRKVLYFDAN
jgi:hypothetical protein